jgi:hypothetical protein
MKKAALEICLPEHMCDLHRHDSFILDIQTLPRPRAQTAFPDDSYAP